jgi:hypothetical protein
MSIILATQKSSSGECLFYLFPSTCQDRHLLTHRLFFLSYSGYRECSRLMVNFHRNSGTGKLTGVHRKYSTSKFGYAVKNEPANFLLEAQF